MTDGRDSDGLARGQTVTVTPSRGRQLMPVVAQWVADLRLAIGAERVDAAIAAGQQARREHQRIAREHGQAAADGWLARQRFPNGCFHAAENGREVGVVRGGR